MRRSLIRPWLLSSALALATVGCGTPVGQGAEPGQANPASAAKADGQRGREDALRAIDALETRVAVARDSVSRAGVDASKLTRADRLHVSDVRRAIVAANVALQKAREALSGGDAATARQVSATALERLSEVLGAKPADRPPAARQDPK